MLAGAFTLRAARRLIPRIERVVSAQLDVLHRSGPPADLFAGFAWPTPGLVICDLLGLPPASTAGVEAAVTVFDAADTTAGQRLAAFAEMYAVMLTAARERDGSPGDDLLSQVLHAPRPVDGGERVSTAEAASFGVALRLAGQAPVAHVLGLGLYRLLREPDGLAALAKRSQRLDAVVDELLRYLPTNNLGVLRVATEDVPLAGDTIRAGELAFVSLPAANRDPSRFVAADRLDLDREPQPHLAFGHGPHKCLGQNLARVELETMLRLLLARMPGLRLAVPADAVTMFESESSYGVADLTVTW
jgi:cytochrome P450